jgi:hypothetical protein
MIKILGISRATWNLFNVCPNLSLGPATKARACKVAGQERKPGSHISTPRSAKECEGMNPHTPKWKPLDLIIFYIIGKLLKRRCLKWARMTHLDIWITSYGQKKRRESNQQFDFRPLKVGNRLDFLACRWRATYHWQTLDKGYNFALGFISFGGLHTKLRGPKVVGVPTLGISGLPFESFGTKCHLDVGLVERHIVYLKGKVVASPKFELWWVLWVWGCLWFVLTPKVLKLCTNQLVVWFVQVRVSD